MKKAYLHAFFREEDGSLRMAEAKPANDSVWRLWSYSLLLTLGILSQSNVVFAQMGKAIELNGTNDYIQAPAGVYFNGNFTAEGWIYPRSYSSVNYCRFFDLGNGTGNGNIALHFGPSGNRLYVLVGSSQSWLDFNN